MLIFFRSFFFFPLNSAPEPDADPMDIISSSEEEEEAEDDPSSPIEAERDDPDALPGESQFLYFLLFLCFTSP